MARTDTLPHFLTDVAEAIRSKGGTSEPIQASSFDTAIANLPSGSETKVENDVNFYDYDGTLVDSYSKTEFLALESLPSNPTHEGLTSQGWNWSLQDAQTYVGSNNKLDIGQMYKTTDDKIHLYVDILNTYVDYYVSFALNGTATIDWGDETTETLSGTSTSTLKTSTAHKYSTTGKYLITISSASDIYILGSTYYETMQIFWSNINGTDRNAYWQKCLYKVELSSNSKLGNGAFYGSGIETITIPQEITTINESAFRKCRQLKHFNFSSSTTTIGNYILAECRNLKNVSLTKSITSIGYYDFQNCSSLEKINLSTLGNFSTHSFDNCSNLKEIIIPSNITLIDAYSLQNCYSIEDVDFSSITDLKQSMFYGCNSLKSVKLNNNITSIPANTFRDCYSLKEINLPNGITSIGNYAFQYATSLNKIVFPSSLTSIGNSTFTGCYSIYIYDFSNCNSIPSLAGSASLTIDGTKKIIVPDSLYNTWITTQYWSSFSSYIIKKSDWDELNN